MKFMQMVQILLDYKLKLDKFMCLKLLFYIHGAKD